MKAIDRAIKKAGGPSALARELGVSPQAVCNWSKRGVPPERVIDIEAAVDGEVTRYELRSDIFGRAPQVQT